MEKKNLQRILGIVVLIGLVVILLPIFGGKNERAETALVKAPPFPDQSVQVNAAAADAAPTVPAQQPAATPASDAAANAASPIPVKESGGEHAENTFNQQPDDTIDPNHPPITNAKAPSLAQSDQITPPPLSPEDLDSKPQLTSDELMTQGADKGSNKTSEVKTAALNPKKIMPSANKPSPASTAKLAAAAPFKPVIKSMAEENGLAKLKNAAWVIQMGSFKNKTNALRLVNQLRASGYPAFIQQFSSSGGDSTRVFVGPENKRVAARALADQLESDLHLRGIVISYKPLTL